MVLLSTGPVENNLVGGVRPTQRVTVRIDNRSDVQASTVSVQGYYMLGGVRNLYVSESINVAANQVITTSYYADLDAFEFIFITPSESPADDPIQVSLWGKTVPAN